MTVTRRSDLPRPSTRRTVPQWLVTATVTSRTSSDGMNWERTTALPTFVLDGGIEGILTEETAEKVARAVIDPQHLYDEIHVQVSRFKPLYPNA